MQTVYHPHARKANVCSAPWSVIRPFTTLSAGPSGLLSSACLMPSSSCPGVCMYRGYASRQHATRSHRFACTPPCLPDRDFDSVLHLSSLNTWDRNSGSCFWNTRGRACAIRLGRTVPVPGGIFAEPWNSFWPGARLSNASYGSLLFPICLRQIHDLCKRSWHVAHIGHHTADVIGPYGNIALPVGRTLSFIHPLQALLEI